MVGARGGQRGHFAWVFVCLAVAILPDSPVGETLPSPAGTWHGLPVGSLFATRHPRAIEEPPEESGPATVI